MTSRRDFLCAAGAAALAGCAPKGPPPLPPGELLGMSSAVGHRLREGGLPEPGETRKTAVVIVGAGISGLSAAWKLDKAGCGDFLLLELEPEAGGNSRYGQGSQGTAEDPSRRRSDVAYPWGAHYLPLPPPEARAVRELLAELGVLQGDPQAARPRYDERYLCATPQERLYRNGLWEEGLLPRLGLPRAEREQQRRFQARMEELQHARGGDGRRAFALPMALSSRDPSWLALDRLSFKDWLLGEGFDAPSLHWLADYACRDDYGTGHDRVSAWAGVHYFACRSGQAADALPETVLTAPEGNGWLARALAQRAGSRLLAGALVWRLAETPAGIAIDCWRAGEGRSLRILAEQAVWAAPAFVLPRVWEAMPADLRAAAQAGDYAPWLTANLHLSAFPQERRGAPPAWDNVLHDGPGLGYVVATHQLLRRRLDGTVFTYYRAFERMDSAAARRLLQETPRETWAEGILAELERAHPDIRRLATRLDVFRNGHAMRRPLPGSLWGGQRRRLASYQGRRLTLAHADLSGFSLFEEAQYRGVLAAERVLARLGMRFASSIGG